MLFVVPKSIKYECIKICLFVLIYFMDAKIPE